VSAAAARLAVPQFVDRLLALRVEVMAAHPAFLPLLSGDDALFRVAEVVVQVVQVVKGLSAPYGSAKPKGRRALIDEYRTVRCAYLVSRLG
jgi:hypothetical protein